jgi:inner membrane transporter RhtA
VISILRNMMPRLYFVVSAVFHYLGPAFAVLLFARVAPLGVAWLRIVAAALVFAIWRRPWRIWPGLDSHGRRTLVQLGVTLAAMNAVFYLAIARLPLATVGAIEFLGPIALAVVGLRGRRNLAALALAVIGVALLTQVRLTGEPIGFVLAFANCALFVFYIVLGKRISTDNGIDRLAMSMFIAAVVVAPFGFAGASPAFTDPVLLAAGVGVGICSSVIPYVCDQLALARLSRATFALLLSLLPATATLIGLVVLAQRPQLTEILGIALVVTAIGVHQEKAVHEERKDSEIQEPGTDRAEGLADRPGDDELRQPFVAGVAPR